MAMIGLAGAHVSLDKTAHDIRLLQIRLDLLPHFCLGAGEFVGQPFDKSRHLRPFLNGEIIGQPLF